MATDHDIPSPCPSLRDRKKAATRAAILDHAERLFEERGYDQVTGAEIADAANISVKTLFVYFRSKEDLAFADTWLIDAVVDTLSRRPSGTSHAQAVGEVLNQALRTLNPDSGGLDAFHRGFGESEALRSRLLRMWADYEDAIATVLAREASLPAPDPAIRLAATQLIGIIRSCTSDEVREYVSGFPGEETDALRGWIRQAVEQVDNGLTRFLDRTSQSPGI
ncbi:TetR/AcrR family transcriptional regulator [Streptomyces sp. GMY02]|uniref:TetR/AcrR family transcriptional regulator n=1 Tax=Streptomyces sp. GMY02 TaxID=1333528 RepID=UPI001C2B7C60|nr:TetR/AcrR family transcriptional regulator [Streptomyces sp. GMY02]QXE38419.1 TetR/AcrR family transcriptional regulator [Streptomyces sp. GMY02]